MVFARLSLRHDKKAVASVRLSVFWLQAAQAWQACYRLLGVVPCRWRKVSVETPLLSRVCARKLTVALDSLARIGGDAGSVRLHFVRGERERGLGPYLSHVVLAWEGADGVRAAAGLCMCGQVANPNYGQG